MKTPTATLLLAASALSLGACSSNLVEGAAIGAAGGAAVGAVSDDVSVEEGAAAGGVGGAVIGAATADDDPD